jgi:hypothetical protein
MLIPRVAVCRWWRLSIRKELMVTSFILNLDLALKGYCPNQPATTALSAGLSFLDW